MLEKLAVGNAEYTFAEHEHRELLGGSDEIHAAGNAMGWTTPAEMAKLTRRVRNWIATVLVPHAAWEDTVIYPEIAQRTGTEWSTKLMRFEHYQIERAAMKLDADIELMRETLTHDQACEVGSHLFALEALLRAHMEREELFLLPILAKD